MTTKEIKQLIAFQVNEATENIIYRRLAKIQKQEHNRHVLEGLSREELRHYHTLQKFTGKTPGPNRWRIFWYVTIARLFGLIFGIKLMEKGEIRTRLTYRQWEETEELQVMAKEEEEHENKLISLIDEEGLNYMSAVVLGLNDALVEFTGALAGYTFALQHPKLVALTGGITGIAAALSMAASEYLSTRADNDGKNAVKASVYTGIAYLITVIALILPFVLMQNVYWAFRHLFAQRPINHCHFQLLLLYCSLRKVWTSICRNGNHQSWNSCRQLWNRLRLTNIYRHRTIDSGSSLSNQPQPAKAQQPVKQKYFKPETIPEKKLFRITIDSKREQRREQAYPGQIGLFYSIFRC